MFTKKLIHRFSATLFLLFSITLFSTAVSARQLNDVTLPDSVTLDGTNVALQLNGMGYRTKFIFDIYVGALYTELKIKSRDAAQKLKGPKRVVMHMVYDKVEREKITNGWNEGFDENNGDEQLKQLQARLKTFNTFFPDLKKGDVLFFDFIPATGTRVTINGKVKGVIEGADFYSALLDVWLGKKPADDDLKEAMLGVEEKLPDY
ncbi:FIG026291: Hypothetical periplasmic protein [hydrothermal vent metagenome]|uniref:FIG026291: Hypothetical periplasmic protein n=1 Tax=hydrothermal vent metagenome TaxID=652676 RepID=A0A3B0WP17_9ZZZZ